VYAVNGSVVDVWIMLAMGLLGYVLRKLGFETAPIVLGVVLAPMIELALRQSLAMSDGRYGIFFQRPIAATLLVVALAMLALSLRTFVRRGLDWRARMALVEKGES
jgi:putative tricarboxylic transport membrane protein